MKPDGIMDTNKTLQQLRDEFFKLDARANEIKINRLKPIAEIQELNEIEFKKSELSNQILEITNANKLRKD